VAAAAEEHRHRQPGRPGRLDDHDQAGAWVGALERGQARDRGAGAAAGVNPAGVVDHHGGVVAGDAKVDPEQTNRRRQVHGGSFPTRQAGTTTSAVSAGRANPATVPGHLA
jgi:hypothetical protein